MRSRNVFSRLLLVFLTLPGVAAAQPDPAPPPDAPPPDAPPPDAPPPEKEAPPTPPPKPPAEEAPPAEEGEAVEGDGEDPARPPPKGKGVVWGIISDTKLNEPLIEVQVNAVGTKFKTLTDIDGRFRLELPPGTYNLRVYYELHEPVRLDRIKVTAGQVARHDVKLKPDEEAVEVMEVETEADRAALEGQTLSRQRSAAVGDSVGRAEISKAPDSNAAEAAQRVVGANIVGGRFVYVRGLGERYTNALLNGSPLPSPEPDRTAVPLDLFPALVLESVTIAKTFTPDVPADFAGGSVQVVTREIPGKFLFSTSLSLGYNTQATFRERLGYRGSSTDFLGFDDGTRALPDAVPGDSAVNVGTRPDGRTVTPEEVDLVGESMNAFMSTRRELSAPNHSLSIVAGNGWQLGGEQRLGVLAAISYGRSFQLRKEILREYTPDPTAPNGLKLWNNFDVETGIDSVRWGGYGSVSYQIAKGHRFTLAGLRSQLSDDTARTFEGRSENIATTIHNTRLSFVSRELDFAQLRGEHDLKDLGDAEVDWNVSISGARRNEPDTRDTVYNVNETTGSFFYVSGAESGRHFFAEQDERSLGAGLDWTQPLAEGPRDTKLKLGGLVSLRDREFRARRFNFATIPPISNLEPLDCGSQVNSECIDKLFTNDNIGTVIRLVEGTRPADSYNAELDIYAAYLMAEVGVTSDVRLIVGERLEVTRQTIEPFDQLNTGAELEGANLKSTDLLPALALVFSATKQAKFRASVTRTLARPQLRELAPFAFSDYFGGRQISGFPGLTLTYITNGDLRFEYFPSLKEVLAFSFFVKRFEDPIEPVVKPASTTQLVTFRNSPGATLIGVEFEARKQLGFITDALKDFTAIGNLTLARSRIEIEQTDVGFITNTSRPLVNQAPYIINLALDYEHESGFGARVLYNVNGPRIVEVGTEGLDDAYEQPRSIVDATISQELGEHFQIKATAENVLNADVLVTQGSEARDDNIIRQYAEGTVLGIGASYTH